MSLKKDVSVVGKFKSFHGTVLLPSLHGGSLEITLTVL